MATTVHGMVRYLHCVVLTNDTVSVIKKITIMQSINHLQTVNCKSKRDKHNNVFNSSTIFEFFNE